MAVFWNCLILLLTTPVVITTANVAMYNTDWLEMMQTLQNEVKDIRNENKELKSRVSGLEDDNRVLQKTVANMKTQNAATNDTLFLATISVDTLSILEYETIIFDVASINPGGYYNKSRGGYTAPYNGYYQFSVQKTGNKNSSLFWILISQNPFTYSGSYIFNDGNPSTAITINIQLTAGQIVRVQNEISTEIYGTHATQMEP